MAVRRTGQAPHQTSRTCCDRPEEDDAGDDAKPRKKNGSHGTLPNFLRDKSVADNQVKKFLATAVWLHDTTGKDRLTTTDVRNALKRSNQTKLNNPSDVLNQNVGKGHAEKDGDGFFITEPGRASLGA